MGFISHPLIKENSIESRLYQEAIFHTARKSNSLVVLPTGIGKTIICVLLAVERMEKNPEGKIIVTAPTRPLCAQHKKTFESILNISPDELVLVTGVIPPEQRADLYKKRLIFITPQTLRNDIDSGIIDLSDVLLLCIDEAHRAVGDYPYPQIAEQYMKKAKSPRILGLTASPGSSSERINEICKNLFIDSVEIRSEIDPDVKPYVKDVEIDWIKIDLPEKFKEAKTLIEKALDKRKRKVASMTQNMNINKHTLLLLQGSAQKRIAKGDKTQFMLVSVIAEALKIDHALELLETQSTKAALNYVNRLKEQVREERSRAVKRVMEDEYFKEAVKIIENLGEDHPKIAEVEKIVRAEMKAYPEAKIIVFSHFRDNVDVLLERLKAIEGCKPVKIIGQKEGLTQKEQISVLRDFEGGFYNCLIGTSISEEGLHLASADIAIFFEPIPSEIRQLQRRGRVGRTKSGKVVILMTKSTRDEKYYWSAFHKEKRMKTVLKGMQTSQPNLLKYGDSDAEDIEA